MNTFWMGQMNSNHQFMKLTPRTAREAFGHSLDAGHRSSDTWVFLAVVLCASIGMLVVSL